MHPSRAATQVVRAWVRAALRVEPGLEPGLAPGLEPGPPPGVPSGGDGVSDLLGAVVRQRVVELVEAHAERVGVPAEVAGRLTEVRNAQRALVPLQLLELSRVRELLGGAGVRHLAIKGPALAVQSAGDVGARGFGDLDVLVDPASVGRLIDLFEAHGWRSSVALPDRTTWAWRRLMHTSNELTFYGASCPVDLHWRLDPTLDGLPGFDELWARREQVEVGGMVVDTLGRADALAHLCLNAARDEWRWLRSLVDIHRVARLAGAWDPDLVDGLAVRALAVTDELVGLPAETPAWARGRVGALPARLRERLLRDAVRGEEGAERRPERPGIASWPGVRYQLAASSTPRDVRRTLGTLVLPGWAVRDVPAATAWRGVPTGMGRRTTELTRRSLSHLAGRWGA